jgi:hypothetical protein
VAAPALRSIQRYAASECASFAMTWVLGGNALAKSISVWQGVSYFAQIIICAFALAFYRSLLRAPFAVTPLKLDGGTIRRLKIFGEDRCGELRTITEAEP